MTRRTAALGEALEGGARIATHRIAQSRSDGIKEEDLLREPRGQRYKDLPSPRKRSPQAQNDVDKNPARGMCGPGRSITR